jgi:serine protease Do
MKRSIPTLIALFTVFLTNIAIGQISNLSELIKKCDPSVFKIIVLDQDGSSFNQGSGCFISSSGIAVSNFHVFANAKKAIAITNNNEKYDILRIIDFNEESDIIKFKVNIGTISSCSALLRGTDIDKGTDVFSLGYPNGFEMSGESTVSTGIISGFRTIGNVKYIQTSAPFTHGSSGGGLFDKQGKLCGITSGTFATDIKDRHANLNKVVPVSAINKLHRNLNYSFEDFYKEISKTNTFAQAMVYYENHEFDEAGLLFLKYLRTHPEDAVAWDRLGTCNWQLTKQTGVSEFRDLAIIAYKNSLELNSTYYYPFAHLSILYCESNDFENAKHYAEKCYAINPKLHYTNYVMGYYYNNTKQYEKAIKYYSLAITYSDKKNNIDQLYLERGIAYALNNQLQIAINDYNKSLEINPNNYDALWNKANVLYGLNRYNEACECMSKLVAKKPNYKSQGYSAKELQKRYCK